MGPNIKWPLYRLFLYKARATRPAPVASLQARLGSRGAGATSSPMVRGCPTGGSDSLPVMSFKEVAEQSRM